MAGGLSQLLAERTGSVDQWYLGDLGQQRNGAWEYFGTDALGSVRFLTDASGQITARADYDPYGVPLPIPGQSQALPSALGFTGGQTDPFGLVNLRARTYNPSLGVFTSLWGFSSSTASKPGQRKVGRCGAEIRCNRPVALPRAT